MKKGQLKALFIEAKGTGQKYIGVMIQTEGSSEPEVIINPKENFNAIVSKLYAFPMQQIYDPKRR